MIDMKELCPYCKSNNILKIAVINGRNRYMCNNKDCTEKTKKNRNKTFYIEKNFAKAKVECPICRSTHTHKSGFGKNGIRYRCKDCEKKEKEKPKDNRKPYWFYENEIKVKEPMIDSKVKEIDPEIELGLNKQDENKDDKTAPLIDSKVKEPLIDSKVKEPLIDSKVKESLIDSKVKEPLIDSKVKEPFF